MIARTADKHAPQVKLCSSLNFCWLWKHRSRFFRLRRKDSDWASLSSILTQVKREKKDWKDEETVLWKTQRTMQDTVQRKMNHSSWMNMLLPTQGARNEHFESVHKTKSAQLGLVRVFPSPKKVFRRLNFIPSALLLSSVRYRFAFAFSGSLSDSFSPASRVHFSRQAN